MNVSLKEELRDIRNTYEDIYYDIADYTLELENLNNSVMRGKLVKEWDEIEDYALELREKIQSFSLRLNNLNSLESK